MQKNKWVWMGHAGHFILGNKCQFHLNTYVGGYIVSTVGEYVPTEGVQEIIAKSRGLSLERMGDAREAEFLKKNGFERLGGDDRTYETMVFKAEKDPANHCCPWNAVIPGGELDMEAYTSAADAQKGHMKLCVKWSRKLTKRRNEI
jgi:hypothetical protein